MTNDESNSTTSQTHGLAWALGRLAQNKDPDAWSLLVAQAGSDIGRMVSCIIGNRILAEDAIQEALLVIRDHAKSFVAPSNDANGAARSWIIAVAARASMQLLRQTKRQQVRDQRAGENAQRISPEVPQPGEQMEHDEETRVLRRELALLPEPYAQALALHFLAGLDYPALALHLHMPATTARTHIHRGLKALRERLQRCGLALSITAITALLTSMGMHSGAAVLLPASALGLLTSSASPTTAFSSAAVITLFPATLGGILMTSGITLSCACLLALIATPLTRTHRPPLPSPSPLVTLVAPVGAGNVPLGNAAADDQAVHHVIEQAIGLGFPDTRGAQMFEGTLTVSHPGPDGAKKSSPYMGFHAHLSDGRWLVNLCMPLRPDALVTMDISKLEPIAEADWFKNRMIICNVVDFPGICGIASACLIRAGKNLHSDFVISSLKDQQSNWFSWSLPSPLGCLGYQSVQGYSRKDGFTASPEKVVRYAISHWFSANVYDIPAPFLYLPAKISIAAAKAILPDQDSGTRTEIDRLVTFKALPAPDEGHGPFDQRLISWCTKPDNAYRPMFGSTELPSTAKQFTYSDLPGLMDLVGDTRPSRWLDAMHPRTIGDQALRAISSVLGMDPRWLIKWDIHAEWGDQQRLEVTAGLGKWWQKNRTLSLEQIRLSAMPNMDLPAMILMITGLTVKERPPYFTMLTQIWKKRPPTHCDDYVYTLFMLGNDIESFVRWVKTWPVSGESRAMLAYWHFQHGDSAPLTSLLEDTLSQSSKGNAHPPTYIEAQFMLAVKPDETMVRRFQHVLAGNLASKPTKALIEGCLGNEDPFYYNHPEPFTWRQSGDDSVEVRRKGLQLVFLTQLLYDPRPIPPDYSDYFTEKAEPGYAIRTDLRISDLSSAEVWTFWWAGIFPSHLPQGYLMDLTQPVQTREVTITFLKTYVHEVVPRMMDSIHMHVPIPGFDAGIKGAGTNDF